MALGAALFAVVFGVVGSSLVCVCLCSEDGVRVTSDRTVLFVMFVPRRALLFVVAELLTGIHLARAVVDESRAVMPFTLLFLRGAL